ASNREHAALPARSLLCLSLQSLAAELEVRVGKGRREIGCGLVGDAERHPCLDRVERRCGEGRGKPREGVGLADDEAIASAELRSVTKGVPVEARRKCRELGRRVWIILDRRIAQFGLVPAVLCDLGLEGDDLRGGGLRLCPAD